MQPFPLTAANNPYYAQLTAPSLPGGFQDLAVQAAVAQASHDSIVGTLASLGFNSTQQAAWTTQLDADLTNSINGLAASPNAAQSGRYFRRRIIGVSSCFTNTGLTRHRWVERTAEPYFPRQSTTR